MTQKRKLIIAVVVAAVLAVVCIVQATIIFGQRSDEAGSLARPDFDGLSSTLREKFSREQRERHQLFDDFFDDDFFSQRSDPFSEMDQLRRQLEEMMGGRLDNTFDHMWDDWYGSRFFGDESSSSGGIRFEQEEKLHSYVIKAHIPNLEKNSLDVEVDAAGISIVGEISQIAEKKDPEGNVVARKEVHRSISKHFALPADADAARAKIGNTSDSIIITIPKANS